MEDSKRGRGPRFKSEQAHHIVSIIYKMVKKKLYRSKKERMIGGVCGGIGEFLEIDPTVVRVIWAFATILSVGIGIIAYILAWIIIPEKK